MRTIVYIILALTALASHAAALDAAEQAARIAAKIGYALEASRSADAAAAAAAVTPPAPPERFQPWHHLVEQSTRADSEAVSAPTALRVENGELRMELAVVAPTPCHTLDTDIRGKPGAHHLEVQIRLAEEGICVEARALVRAAIRVPGLAEGDWAISLERPEGRERHSARIP